MVFHSSPKLLIAIPCYKRPDLLYRLLLSIYNADSGLNVQIILADDSPEGANESVFHKARKLGLTIEYIHNVNRLGIDANIDQCLMLPGTDYVWLMGEDDLITPSGITEILNKISGWPNLVFANYSQAADDGVQHFHSLSLRSLFVNKQEYVDALLINFGFIGSVVIKSSTYSSHSYLDLHSYFSHVGVIVDVIDQSDLSALGFIPAICSINRVGGLDTFSWGRDALKVYTGFYKILSYISSSCPPISFSLARSINRSRQIFYPLYKISRVIRLKSLGLLTFKDALLLYKNYGGSLACLVASLTPRPIAFILAKIATRIFPKYRILS